MFVSPKPTNHVYWHELNESLIVIEPIEADKEIVTHDGHVRRATVANIYVIDGPYAGDVIEHTYIFPGGIRAAVRRHVGQFVLGRVAQGVPAVAGHVPPWMFEDATNDPADVALASIVMNENINH